MRTPTWKAFAPLALAVAAACGGSATTSTAPAAPTHHLRVAVSGLAGSGLALHSSLGDDLAVPADGTYAFATAAAAGTAYAITIAAQPTAPWQTCGLSAEASGTLGAADVSVAVACATNRYPVSAHVSGLTGSGLSLRLGLEAVDPVADGTVTFVTSVASGESYTVAVAAQPTAPWQTCAGAGGTVADRAVSVDVGCTTNRYRVGVTASGVLGSGLSLQCGGDTLPIDASGVFTFATSIASGDAYGVGANAVPPTETCTFSGSVGVVGGADVAVGIQCTCQTGRGDCDLDPTNGCETDVWSDPQNCDGCGIACAPVTNGSPACTNGACGVGTCNFGFADCDRSPANGCETNTNLDTYNCGACGSTCASYANALSICANGGCTLGPCNPGWADCDGNAANGCETNVTAIGTGTGACATCSDGHKNGNETDVDCGGSCVSKCVNAKSCAVNADCASGYCNGSHACADAPVSVMVVRVGNGTDPLTGAAAQVVLERWDAATGASQGTVSLPTAASGANQPFTLAGSSTAEGALSRSADGRYVTLAGYAATPLASGVGTSASATTHRVVARVDGAGSVDTSTHASMFDGAPVRAATSADGTAFWVAGGAAVGGATDGVQYLTLGSTVPVQILATPATVRTCGIFSGQLFCDSSNAWNGPFTVGTGLPTTAGQVATLDPAEAATTGASPYAFVLLDRDANVPGLDTLYVADDRSLAAGGGLAKWTFDGSAWTLAATWSNGLSLGLRGLTAYVRGSSVVLVATTAAASANQLVKLVDDGTPSPSFTVLATAGAGTGYRGVALAPAP